MISSMTGFAIRNAENQYAHLRLEIKSVNHRYLEIQCRLPEEFRFLEGTIRQHISNTLLRGKVECRLQIQLNGSWGQQVEANWPVIDQLAELNRQIGKKYSHLKKMAIADILKLGGLKNSTADTHEYVLPLVEETLKASLRDFKADRCREGVDLKNHLSERLQEMERVIQQLQSVFPQLLQQHMDKLRNRLQEALNHIDEDRIKQEFAFFIQKSDVDEEFSRLSTHISEVRRILEHHNRNGAGKRLDFLMQELNREANTLGSKSIAAECTQASVELKVLIEQMREQVQNIE